MALTKVAPAGIGSTPGDGYRIGSSFLHSTGVELTNANASGIVTAAQFDGKLNIGIATFSDDVTFQTANSKNIVFDKSANRLDFGDSVMARFGDTGDLQISHNGTDSIIKDAGVGRLKILGGFEVKNVGDTQTLITANVAGASAKNVELYYSNVKRLETSGIGVTVTGQLDVGNVNSTGVITATKFVGDIAVGSSITYADNEKAYFGTDLDLQIYHSGTHGFISNSTNDLKIDSDNIKIRQSNSNAFIKCEGTAVKLHFNDNEKLATTNTGVTVTGALTATSFVGGLPITNGADNRVITASSASAIQGEANLTYDGANQLKMMGSGQQDFMIGSTNAGGAYLILDGDSNGDAIGADYAYIAHDTGGDVIIGGDNPSGDAAIIFKAGNNAEKVRITSGGIVGINQSSPDSNSKLDVMSDATGTTVNSNRVALFRTNGGGRDAHITLSNSSNTPVHIGQLSSDLYFTTNNAERLRITSAGKLGVGEASPTTKLHVKDGTLMIHTTTNFHLGSGENGENYPTIFFKGDHSSGNNPAHGKITVRHSAQNPYSGDILLMPQGHYGGSYGYQEVLRVSAYKRVGINESSPSTALDIKGDGVPMVVNSSNSNTFKLQLEDNGTVRGYIGCDNTNLLNLANSSAASKFKVNTAGVTHNVDGSTHGSGVFMCEIHTDLLKLLKSSTNHPNTTGNYYSWSDGGTASWSWDNGVLRMDSNVGSHTWQCGSVYLTAGYYTLMQCWRACSDAHGWSNFGSSSNGNSYSLTDDAAYGSYNTLLTSYTGQHARNDGKSRWYGTTSGNLWHYVSSAGTYRIQQMGQPYGSGGYKYYILAAYLLKLK